MNFQSMIFFLKNLYLLVWEKHWFVLLIYAFIGQFFFFLRFYSFLERKEEREGGRETSVCVCILHPPGSGLQPMHAPLVGMEPTTLWFTGLHWNHWATPARAHWTILICALTKAETQHLGESGQRSHLLCYPARAAWYSIDTWPLPHQKASTSFQSLLCATILEIFFFTYIF